MTKSKVYFVKGVSPENVIKAFKALGVELKGNVAVKLHSGEQGNQNFLGPEFVKPMVDFVGGTVVECNTAYAGERNTTEKHKKTLEKHGWSKFFKVDLMDENDDDLVVSVKNGKILKTNRLGNHIQNYDSMLVLSHFKGHPMGGFGGALKQLSIGCASSRGKALIHSAGVTDDQAVVWGKHAKQNDFLEAMADAASTVVDMFKDKIAFVNVMANMSVDCDCCAVAEDPCLSDIGVLASLDPVAIDKACLDLVYASNDKGREHFIERVESRNGGHIVDAAFDLGVGNKEYELVEIK